jgi:hypothetical protein
MKLKYPDQISDQWDYSKVKTKDEMTITNTYINTRIFSNENNKEEDNDDDNDNDKDKDTNTYRKEIESKMPANNRNVNQKSSTYNNDPVIPNPNTKLRWRDQINENKSLYEVIGKVENNSKAMAAKRAKELTKITCHREHIILKPIISPGII